MVEELNNIINMNIKIIKNNIEKDCKIKFTDREEAILRIGVMAGLRLASIMSENNEKEEKNNEIKIS